MLLEREVVQEPQTAVTSVNFSQNQSVSERDNCPLGSFTMNKKGPVLVPPSCLVISYVELGLGVKVKADPKAAAGDGLLLSCGRNGCSLSLFLCLSLSVCLCLCLSFCFCLSLCSRTGETARPQIAGLLSWLSSVSGHMTCFLTCEILPSLF